MGTAALRASALVLRMLDNFATMVTEEFFIAVFLFGKVVADVLEEYRTSRGYADRFEKKYDREDLFIMAMEVPEKDATIKGVWTHWPYLSKNHAAEVADIRKNVVRRYKEIFRGNSR